MAGDWIKIEENTPDKPEVHKMASILGIDPDAVVGKLVRVWSWASQNCNGDGVTDVTVKALLNRPFAELICSMKARRSRSGIRRR